jgi:tetratricopeptide (TPR) repeat protein
MKITLKVSSPPKNILLLAIILCFTTNIFAQATHAYTDAEADYKKVREFIAKEEYAFAYPLIKDLKAKYGIAKSTDHSYINEDINYFNALCELKLMQDIGKDDAEEYINSVSNEPRKQIMSYHLAHYYFLKNDFSKAITAYEDAGYDNLSNEQIADAKFEKAYCQFNLKRFNDAKPLFNEIHQVPKGKYYIPANYYFGFISYYEKDYTQALKCFKLVEQYDEYKTVVPYYIAEILYFQGKKDEALTYGEAVLERNTTLYYDAQLRLLLGQIHFEKKNYTKALPLLENYVNNTSKVTKEILYEVSYCYYIAGNNNKAIEGFKQLSSEKDSMGQNSMYLLGDLYLKQGDKANARTAFQYCAYNSSNANQQKVSLFNYAKLSFELGYQSIALTEIKSYLKTYPNSEYDVEAKEILLSILARTNNFNDALAVYKSLGTPTTAMQKIYPTILYGKAIEYVNDQRLYDADDLFSIILKEPYADKVAAYANFWKGEIAYRQQNYDAAIRYLLAFVSYNPLRQGEANTTNANYNLAYCYLQKENYVEAANYFEKVNGSGTTAEPTILQDAAVRTADAYYMQRNYTKAGSIYDNVINSGSAQSDYAAYQKAMIAGIKNGAEKIRLLNNVAKQYPKSTLQQEINMQIANTYIAETKFGEAVPYLNNVIASTEGGMKPTAYLKLGLAHYNNKNNVEALKAYNVLIRTYPQSQEADEAIDIVKSIYAEEGRTDEYIVLMNQVGKTVTETEADSLTYSTAINKYDANDCAGAIAAFTNYTTKFPNGAKIVAANFYRSDCYQKNKDIANALIGYDFVNSKGYSKFFERATLEAARIAYFDNKDYVNAKRYFESLRAFAVNQDNQSEALRGLVRCYYQTKDYTQANIAAKELLAKKGITTDDKSIGFLVLGKSQQVANDCASAIASLKSCAAINKSAWGAEARYEIANCHFNMGNYKLAEKAALATIKETGSYDEWVTKSYILLGDNFMQQKDYFNAKATYESVAKNTTIPELKTIAEQKLAAAIETEKSQSKIGN